MPTGKGFLINHASDISADESTAFREAMSRWGTAVHVITTDGDAGRCGVTASAVCSVSDAPPTLLVCLNRASETNTIFKENGVLCVNTLAAGAEELAEVFAGRSPVSGGDRFRHGSWTHLATGSPALTEARVAIDCRISQVSEVGTHSVLFGEVAEVRLGEPGPALMYRDRTYHAL